MSFWFNSLNSVKHVQEPVETYVNTSIYLFYKPWPDIVNLLEVIDEIKAQKLNIHIQTLIKNSKTIVFPD